MSIDVESGCLELNRDNLSLSILRESITELVLVNIIRNILYKDVSIISLFYVSLDRGIIVSKIIDTFADMLIDEKESTVGKLFLVHLIHSFGSAIRFSKGYITIVLEVTFSTFISLNMSGNNFTKFLEHLLELSIISTLLKVLNEKVSKASFCLWSSTSLFVLHNNNFLVTNHGSISFFNARASKFSSLELNIAETATSIISKSLQLQ